MDQPKLITMTDGQQILVIENDSLKIDIGIIDGDDHITVAKKQALNVTPEQYKQLSKDAMTKTIEIDTMTQDVSVKPIMKQTKQPKETS